MSEVASGIHEEVLEEKDDWKKSSINILIGLLNERKVTVEDCSGQGRSSLHGS